MRTLAPAGTLAAVSLLVASSGRVAGQAPAAGELRLSACTAEVPGPRSAARAPYGRTGPPGRDGPSI